MMNFTPLLILSCVLAAGGDSKSQIEKPLIAWRFDVFLLKDRDPRSSVSAVWTNDSNITRSHEADNSKSAHSMVPRTPPTDSTSPFLSVFESRDTVDIATVTLVEDGQIVDMEGTRIRIRGKRQFEIAGDLERPLEKSLLVHDGESARLLVTAYGEKAENYSQRVTRRISELPSGNVPGGTTEWVCDDVTLGAVGQDGGDAILVDDLRLGRRLLEAIGPRPVNSEGYSRVAEAVVSASFWIRPSQTAVIRLPRLEGEPLTVIAFVRIHAVETTQRDNSRQGNSGPMAGKSNSKFTRAEPVTQHLKSP